MTARGELDDLVFPIPKTVRIRDRAHLERIVGLGCCIPGCPHGWASFADPWYRAHARKFIHAHHVRVGAGTGIKPSDSQAVGICAPHHYEGHHTGWETFERKHTVDLQAISNALWGQTLELRSRK